MLTGILNNARVEGFFPPVFLLDLPGLILNILKPKKSLVGIKVAKKHKLESRVCERVSALCADSRSLAVGHEINVTISLLTLLV